MPDPVQITRRLRRSIDRPGLRAEVAADINLAVSTGAPATAEQHGEIRQVRARQGQVRPDRPRVQPSKEQP